MSLQKRVTRLEIIIDEMKHEHRERSERLENSFKELQEQFGQFILIGRGIKKAIWTIGPITGTIAGGVFAYIPQIIDFLYAAIHVAH